MFLFQCHSLLPHAALSASVLMSVGLKQYIVSVIERCRALGFVTTIAGRRRYLPSITSTSNRPGRAQAERQAVNTSVQGSAADLVKLATIRIQNFLPNGETFADESQASYVDSGDR